MATYWPVLHESRILRDSTRADQSGAADGDVTGWNKKTYPRLIVAVAIGYNGKDTAASSYKLRWYNVTDAGTMADVGSNIEDEIHYTDTSGVLVDGTAITSTTRRCTARTDQTWQNGLENVGDNLVPDSSTLDLASDCYSELQFAVDVSRAHEGDQYAFGLYNVTQGAAVGTCLANVTIAADAPVTTLITTDPTEFTTARPALDFSATDMSQEGSPQILIATDTSFTNIVVNATYVGQLGFSNVTRGGSIMYFGDTIRYTCQSDLSNGTYYWKVRFLDDCADGSSTWGSYASYRTITVNVAGADEEPVTKRTAGVVFSALIEGVW